MMRRVHPALSQLERPMRRSLIALASGLLLTLALVVPASASSMCESGQTFGSMHISVEARNGVLGPELHPGMHRGFSECVR